MTKRDLASELDDYFNSLLLTEDEALLEAKRTSTAAGLPNIAVSAGQGKFLQLFALAMGAKRILEIGTLGGYSTIWLARSLPEGGKLVSLEHDPNFAKIAESNIDSAGLADKVDVVVGDALESLFDLRGEEPFDFIFIDADNKNVPGYLGWAIRLGRPGTVIIVDNVVRNGRVLDENDEGRAVIGTRKAVQYVHDHPRLDGVALQTTGVKGHDGYLIARLLP